MTCLPTGMANFLGLTTAALFGSAIFPSPAKACTLCSCSASTSDVTFGVYDPNASTPDDAAGTVSVNCTGVVALFGSVDVAASAGLSGNPARRVMKQGQNTLEYNIFVDSARTLPFGDGTSGSSRLSASLNGLLLFGRSFAVYGRIPRNQRVRAGTYSDAIVITVRY